MLNVLFAGECGASGADFGILLLPKSRIAPAAPFQHQQLLNLPCIQVRFLPGVVHYIFQYETLTFDMKGIYFI